MDYDATVGCVRPAEEALDENTMTYDQALDQEGFGLTAEEQQIWLPTGTGQCTGSQQCTGQPAVRVCEAGAVCELVFVRGGVGGGVV